MKHTLTRRVVMVMACLAVAGCSGMMDKKPVAFSVPLSGAQQVPPVQTAGSGKADLTWDGETRKVTWNVTYSGLSGPAMAAHFHNGAAGTNGPVVVWISKQGSPVENPAVGEAVLTPDQAAQFVAGGWYINVHTPAHGPGEIRGQVVPPKG